MSNWPSGTNYGSQNWTGRTPHQSEIDADFDESDKIPPGAWLGAILVLAVFFWVFVFGAVIF